MTTQRKTPNDAAREHMAKVLNEAVEACDDIGYASNRDFGILLRLVLILANHERVRLTGANEEQVDNAGATLAANSDVSLTWGEDAEAHD